MIKTAQKQVNREEIRKILQTGAEKIAPLWSLENFVAVNPYLGMTNMKFFGAMDFLHKSSHIKATLPIQFYLDAHKEGRLNKSDIQYALDQNSFGIANDLESFLESITSSNDSSGEYQIHTLVDVASEINGKKWRRFMIDRISFWASAYFDQKQATWDTSNGDLNIFKAWKREAEVDFSTETMGLKGFRKFVMDLPDDYIAAASISLEKLNVPHTVQDHYLNSLLMKMNGWAGFAARIDWDAKLAGQESHAVEEFLAILLTWELALMELLKYPELQAAWNYANQEAVAVLSKSTVSDLLAHQLILQEAFDHANQRMIIQKINDQKVVAQKEKTPEVQAAFCIDVRSELYRRNLESVDEGIETIGFAGFFGFPIKYVPLAHEEGVNQCPVLLNTSHTVVEKMASEKEEQRAIKKRTFRAQMLKSWKAFKQGAISCFGFVSPLGLFYLPKLISDSFGLTRPLPHPDQTGLSKKNWERRVVGLDTADSTIGVTGIPYEDRLNMAHSALKAMSLTDHFAPIVLIVGHGSSTVNNPHGTGLDCGACGGHTGEANAKVAAAVLNDAAVREGLKQRGIQVPEETLFVAALHDTTTDEVRIFNEIPHSHIDKVNELKYSLALASESARKERAGRMKVTGNAIQDQVIHRSKDWSQVRPEWGLAGCSSFIVAPRARTAQLNFEGKAFMHNYSWQKDEGFGVLEVIMTAPMVVTSWINLQYYASTVDNKKFGSGNKTLHNIVGGLGVLEGFTGDLRVGLPWQSIHDGTNYQHEPQRLNVFIEAPVDEMSKILAKHESIRQLCDNQWIYLFAINNEGKVAYKYVGDLEWELI